MMPAYHGFLVGRSLKIYDVKLFEIKSLSNQHFQTTDISLLPLFLRLHFISCIVAFSVKISWYKFGSWLCL